MAKINQVDIAGTQGKMQNEPRVFAHDAKSLNLTLPDPITADLYVDVLPTGTPSAGDEVTVLQRGACVYVGGTGDVDVEMESGERVTFKAVNAGSFLPILITKVYLSNNAGTPTQTTTATDILALF